MEYKPPKREEKASVDLTDEQKAKVDMALANAMERKRAEYGNRS